MQPVWMTNWFSLGTRPVFLMLCIVQMALIFIQEDIIGFRADFFDLLEDIGETGMAYLFLRAVELGGYLIVPFQIALKTALIGMLLWFGTFAFGYKASYKSLWRAAILAVPMDFVQQILKILWFGFVDTNYEQFDLDSFHNFSPTFLLSESMYDGILYRYFDLINPGTFLYLWFLAHSTANAMNRPFKVSLWVVLTFVAGIGFLWKGFVWIVG